MVLPGNQPCHTDITRDLALGSCAGAWAGLPTTHHHHHTPPDARAKDQWRIVWACNGLSKWVKRLNLLFAAESRPGFRFRLQQARRRQAEVRLALVVHAALQRLESVLLRDA